MRLEDLDYELPAELIAQRPAVRREDARMLVVERDRGRLTDARIADLPEWLRPGDGLVLNETRVRPARLAMRRRPSGGKIEVLFVRPEPRPPQGPERWRVLARPARVARVGTMIEAQDELELKVVETGDGGERIVEIVRGDPLATLSRLGRVPLPPYIRHAPGPEDRERYQTVYARTEGAVAAPTAGLHFSEPLLETVEKRGVRVVRVLLHVGPGTFRPITSADPRAHRMDEEYFEVSAETAAALEEVRAGGGRVVPVGTTAVRALESACDANAGKLGPASGWTTKYILPPYGFQAADALLTNFHVPRTTLLLLVAAFAGESLLLAAYRHAVEQRYRFYSYGDAMLLV